METLTKEALTSLSLGYKLTTCVAELLLLMDEVPLQYPDQVNN